MPIITASPTPTGIVSAPANSQSVPKPAVAPVGANTAAKAPSSPVEAPAQVTPAAPTTDERLALLARKERAIQAKAQELKAKQAEYEARQAPAKAVFDPKGFRDAFLRDPMSVGITSEELQQLTLNQMGQSPESQRIRQLEAKIEELTQGVQSSAKQAEEQQTKAYQQAVKQIENEVNSLVDSSDAYEVVKAQGRQKSVVALIERTYKEDGILLSAEDAASQVEEHLLQQALTLTSLSKVKAKLLPPQLAPTPQNSAQQTQASPAKQQTHTLTQAMSQASSRPLTSKERRERAILAMQGKLAG